MSLGADVNYQDKMYGSAPVTAINNGNEVLIEWLIDKGVNVNLVNEHDIGPLEIALRSNAKPGIVKLLVWAGAKLNRGQIQHRSA